MTQKDTANEANETGASRRLLLDNGIMIFDAPWVEEFGGYHFLAEGTEDGSVCMDRETMQRLYDLVDTNCAILIHETEIENVVASDDADGTLVSEEEFDSLEDDKYEDYSDEERGVDPEDESEYEEVYEEDDEEYAEEYDEEYDDAEYDDEEYVEDDGESADEYEDTEYEGALEEEV